MGKQKKNLFGLTNKFNLQLAKGLSHQRVTKTQELPVTEGTL